MFRIDNSTAAAILPTPKPVGQPGYFSCGTIGGQDATIVEADWLNQVQEEILNVLTAAGVAPSKLDNTQLITAILLLIQNNTRRRLNANLDLYCSPSGSDSNNGLTPSTAWQTPQRAWNYIMSSLDIGAFGVTIHLADGSYPGVSCSGSPVGQQAIQVMFQGDVVNPAAVVLSGQNTPGVLASVGAILAVDSLTVQSSGTNFGGNGLLALPGGTIAFSNIHFAACTSGQVVAEGGQITATGPYSISGNAGSHAISSFAGSLDLDSAHVTITNTPTFSNGFAALNETAVAMLTNMVFTGTAHGPRFGVSTNAVLNLGGQNPNTYLPGDAAGTTASGGLVV